MLRRNFFATLLAPLVARFAPKRQRPGLVPVDFEPLSKPIPFDRNWVTVRDWYTKTGHYRQVGNGPIEFVDNWPTPMVYWTEPFDTTTWDVDA